MKNRNMNPYKYDPGKKNYISNLVKYLFTQMS